MQLTEISLVVPAYNEESRITSLLENFTSFFSGKKIRLELIVVADGSDRTAEMVRAFKAPAGSTVKVIESKKRMGKGGAVITGLKSASSDLVGFVDSDESVGPEDVLKLFYSLEKADCAVASRRAPGAVVEAKQPFMRRLASFFFNWYVRALFNLGLSDTQCGAKAFRRDTITPVLGEMRSTGFEFDPELLWRLSKRSCRILEVPVTWRHEKGSKFSLWKSPSMFLSLLRIRLGI